MKIEIASFSFYNVKTGGSKESDKSCLKMYLREGSVYFLYYNYSNVLIAPCSTADPGIAGAVLLQNKTNTKIERLIILD